MATSTTNLSLTKPDVNSATDEDLWGGQLNTNMDTLDSEAATATIDKDFNDKVVSKGEMKDLSETSFSLGSINGAVAVDYEDGHYQYGTLDGNITSITVSNFPASGKVGFLTLELTQDGTGSRTLALSSAYITAGGVTPLLTTAANSVDILRLETRDAGTTIHTFLNLDLK